MFQTIILNGVTIKYLIKRSRRSRHLRISIVPQHGLVVTIPWRMSEHLIEPFLREKADWILKSLRKMEKYGHKIPVKISKEEYAKNKNRAELLITERVIFFNQFYKFSYQKISVRNQTSLWGSCTRSGNLQFNYKLLRLPPRLLDYVVVHELCHLKEHNHSDRFWRLVEKILPDHKQLRKSLRNHVMQVA